MKRCPTCNRTFTDRNLSFCIDDGTPLIQVPEENEPTAVTPGGRSTSDNASGGSSNAPPYQPPGTYVPPGSQRAGSSWPWVIGILAVLFIGIIGIAIAAAVMIPRMVRSSRNSTRPPANISVDQPLGPNANSNSNTNESANENENTSTAKPENNTPPPTDSAVVLSDLSNLENEWTVANINADKKALDRILADDFVGKTDGRTQGKAEYLRTIERDTAIEKWEFEGLKVNLRGDRATLTGTLKLHVNGGQLNFSFTDKFVWRDGRWQATSSDVRQLQ
jgi:hypothetical protein